MPDAQRLACFRGRCSRQSACLSTAEGARIERAWGACPNLGLANRCRCYSASLPNELSTVPGTRTLNLHGLNVAPLTNWARTACERIPGFEPGPSTMARSRSSPELHPHGARAVIRCRPGPPALQGQGHGRVRRRALGGIRTRSYLALDQARLPVAARALRAATRVEPGHPPYEGGAASRARRRSCPPWIRTTTAEFRVRRPTVRPMGIGPFHHVCVRHQGLEPRTSGLRIRHSNQLS
jgi:hypothetical protein